MMNFKNVKIVFRILLFYTLDVLGYSSLIAEKHKPPLMIDEEHNLCVYDRLKGNICRVFFNSLFKLFIWVIVRSQVKCQN